LLLTKLSRSAWGQRGGTQHAAPLQNDVYRGSAIMQGIVYPAKDRGLRDRDEIREKFWSGNEIREKFLQFLRAKGQPAGGVSSSHGKPPGDATLLFTNWPGR